MRVNYHRQINTEKALISQLDYSSKQAGHKKKPRAKKSPAHIPPPQHKKQLKIVDGKIKQVFVKIERPPFWERPKNKEFLNLIESGHAKKAFYKKLLFQKLEKYNKENPHRLEPIPEWLTSPDQAYRIVEIEKDKSYQIVNRKDGTLVMDRLKTHKQAMWNLHNRVLKGGDKTK